MLNSIRLAILACASVDRPSLVIGWRGIKHFFAKWAEGLSQSDPQGPDTYMLYHLAKAGVFGTQDEKPCAICGVPKNKRSDASTFCSYPHGSD